MRASRLQLSLIRDRIRAAKSRPDSLYARKFADIDENGITSPGAFESLPFTEKGELRDGYPLGIQAVPDEDVVRIHSSSGTTGAPIIIPYTQRDVDDWSQMFARCYEMAGIMKCDRIHITPGYGLWTAGIGFQLGCERLGAMAIPMGPGNTDKQIKMMIDLKSTVLCATSSYALLLAEEIAKRGVGEKIHLKKGVIGSERWGDKMRDRIARELGVELYDIYGLTEIYGPGIGISCGADTPMHYWDDFIYLEIIDPKTGEVRSLMGKSARSSSPPSRRKARRSSATARTTCRASCPERVRLRIALPAHRPDHRPKIGRHGEGQGCEHLPRSDRGRFARDRRRVQRIPGHDRPSDGQG